MHSFTIFTCVYVEISVISLQISHFFMFRTFFSMLFPVTPETYLVSSLQVFPRTPCCLSGKHAVLRPAAGHGDLGVDPLRQPLPGQGGAAVGLRRRRQSHAERGGARGPVQKRPVPVVGLSAHVP